MNVSTRTIYRWTEAGRIHFTESSLLFLYKSSTAVKSKQQRHLYEFGPFSLDTTDRFLLRAGQPVSLPPKARSLVGSLNEGDTDAPCRLLENFVINGECRPRRLPKLV